MSCETALERFSVGYRLIKGRELFSDIVLEFRQSISEVYFAWPGEASGRSPLVTDSEAQLRWELARLRDEGIPLGLLLNASCYGDLALSARLERRVLAILAELADGYGISTVTTMSPLVARAAKRHFPELDVRGSVNMRLGTVAGLEYVADLFDSFCIQREFNRDARRLEELESWAAGHGKQIHVLANSGCLGYCSFQSFHDNIVSHERAVNDSGDALPIGTLCKSFFSTRSNIVHLVRTGTWIRPEDISLHRRHFGGSYKLATRQHDNPRRVIEAYASGRFRGNLLDLLEPGLGPTVYPLILDNSRFPERWFEEVLQCGKCCAHCSQCDETCAQATVDLEYALL